MSTVILGGGLSGLAAGHYLLKAKKQHIILLEKSEILGGWLKSIKDPVTGVIFEKGPHTIRARGNVAQNTLQLVEELDLSTNIKAITGDHPGSSNRLIFAKNQLHYLPSDFRSLFKKSSPFSMPLIFSAFKFFFAPTKICEDESIYSFVERKFGKEIAEYIISPMICGICAGNSKQISVKFLFSALFEAEQKHGSFIKGVFKGKMLIPQNLESNNSELCQKAKNEKWSVWGFEGGMKTLSDGLECSIRNKGGYINVKSVINKINFKKRKVICQNGDTSYEFSHLMSGLPAKTLAQLVSDEHPILSKELASIPFVSVAVINIVYRNNVLNHNAFGFLVPPSERLPILGVIFDSCIFPQNINGTVLTVMMGGAWFDDHLGKTTSDIDLLKIALAQLKNILGINENPDSYHISVLNDCIPQYVIGHYEKVQRIMEYIKQNKLPLSLIGSSFSGIGVNDVIMSSKNQVNSFLMDHDLRL